MRGETKQMIFIGFGVLLLAMTVAQLVSFSHFYHTLRTYLTPVGPEIQLIDPFILPITFVFMTLHGMGASGVLLMSADNALRPAFIKAGLLVMLLWCMLITSILIRGAPISFVGFFGDKLRQPVNFFALLQSVIFAVWGFVTYQISQEES